MSSYVEAQKLRKADKLIAARKELIECGAEACPAGLRKDCIEWLSEVEAVLPTVVVVARSADGRDLVEVSVSMDGELLTGRLDGRVQEVDPGPHLFQFDFEGAPSIRRQVIIRQGDKARKISVTFPIGEDAPPAPAVGGDRGPSSSSDARRDDAGAERTQRPTPAMVYVLGSVGVVALGGFGALALSFDGKLSELDDCKPNCDQAEVDSAESTRRLAFVALGVGVVSLAVAGAIYIARPEVAQTAERAKLPPLDVTPIPGGAAVRLRARF